MGDVESRNIINECMDIVITESENLRELIEEFNMFARLPKADKHVVNLLSLLNDTISLYKETYRNILFNIILNAVYIIGAENGIISIEVLEINDNIEIYIRDNGTGIDENDIPNLFKPYFSRRQGGTGLGLAIVKKIVEEHSGTITADNNDAGGAYFKIILPRGL